MLDLAVDWIINIKLELIKKIVWVAYQSIKIE